MSDRTPSAAFSWANAFVEQAKAHQECYLAGVRAADENSPSARKLAALIHAIEAFLGPYEPRANCRRRGELELRRAVEDAKS